MSFFTGPWIWLAAMVFFLIIEAIVPGLVSIWFAIGSLVACGVAALDLPLWLQIITFILVSIITLLLTRPLARKYVNEKVQPTNADAVIGKECLVTEKIDNLYGTGAVYVGGKTWTAVSEENRIFEPGEHVIALRIEGVKLIVK